jgi:hypothetical protein
MRKALTDEMAARMLAGFRAGSVIRPFFVKTSGFKAYGDGHPEYAREVPALLTRGTRVQPVPTGSTRSSTMLCTWSLLPYLRRMQDLEGLAVQLLEAARKLPPGQARHEILKEIGQLRVRIDASRRTGAKPRSMNKPLQCET